MTATRFRVMAMVAVLASVGGTATAAAHGSGDDDEGRARARLIGYREVPAISTEGHGRFRARMISDDAFRFRLSYRDIASPVQQAHIHLGQKGVSGGVAVFLCSNLGNGPAGTAPCPQSGVVTGTIRAAQVIGPKDQGISRGEFDEVLDAIRAGVTYANVHSEMFPTGEIRGQLGSRRHHH